MTKTATRLVWRAGKDRLAHALQRNAIRALCGTPVVPERLEWPAELRCAFCELMAAQQ